MKILFCNIAWMDRYAGNLDGNDQPQGGGRYVVETKDAHEKYNFYPVKGSYISDELDESELYCRGFVETNSRDGKSNQLRLENISGCESLKHESSVDGVTVVFCARYPYSNKKETLVVGWYKKAKVYRNYEKNDCVDSNISDFQLYNFVAKKEDCVLLPTGVRVRGKTWEVPRKSNSTIPFGFGRSELWYANDKNNDKLDEFVNRIYEQIESYSGDNWI